MLQMAEYQLAYEKTDLMLIDEQTGVFHLRSWDPIFFPCQRFQCGLAVGVILLYNPVLLLPLHMISVSKTDKVICVQVKLKMISLNN